MERTTTDTEFSGEERGDPLLEVPVRGEGRLDGMAKLIWVVDRLRAPDGCPWDLKQTLASMAPSLIEEAFEAVEAIEVGDAEEGDAKKGNGDGTLEELGDVLLVVTLMGKIAEQEGRFDLGQMAEGVARKLVRRHPHVFGDVEVADTDEVLSNWERIKKEERRGKEEDASALAGVPKALPALQRTYRLSQKATVTGFRWDDAEGALRKVEEEVRELREAFEEAGWADGNAEQATPEERAHLEHELGDLLIAAGFLGQYVGIEPERAARGALRRFEARFRHMEASLGAKAGQADLETWMSAWRAAKDALQEEERRM